MRPFILCAAIAAAIVVPMATASASVVMNATRYVYPAAASEITVKVSNVGKVPALMQAWIDDGDAKATPETVNVPFNLTPPIARIEAGKAQTLRISFTGGDLPTDRESVFWLNVLEVPPKPAEGTANSHLQLALRYRMKLFYRPSTLKGAAESAPANLAWSRDGTGLVVRNDSDFHVAVNALTVKAARADVELEPFSIDAHASRSVPAGDTALPSDATTIHFQTINDYGGFVEHDAKLVP
ncbi:hypothetical protein VI08_07465 [Luteibacter yeojuensis]|uniref:Pilus assembly protein PapD n=1 Tax=Luteibacter yeojuensis TaxID=345309 RepID=A0A0F3KY17_9GAMM|nr:hypothetical protein VI08_07465 [Luteibacter yeojuensis]